MFCLQVSPPSHSSFSKRLGPSLIAYLAAWCGAEHAFISIPDAVVPNPDTSKIGKLLLAIGLHRVDALTTAEGQFRVFGILAALGAVTWLTRVARTCPTEREIEEAIVATGGSGLPADFVRLETKGAERLPEIYDEEAEIYGYDSDPDGDPERVLDPSGLNDEDGDPGRPPRVLAAAAYASARNAASEDRVRRSGEAGDSRASYTDLDAERLPGWERPAVALLSNLLVPLSLWLVALSKDDLLHAALLFAFLMTLVWPGDTGVLRNTGRVIAVALSLMYPWALDHVPELTGLNRESWVPALKLVGLWQPDVVRAMVPMACILVINCLVLNLPKVVEILLPLDREETGTDADDVDARRGERRPTTGVTWEAFWALATASAAEAWLFTVRLVDGCGAYAVVLTGAFIVAAGECSLLNLALLKLVGAALIVPLPHDPKHERNSPRWRALLGFALVNLGARYAFGAFPLARWLGLPLGTRVFLNRTVGLAPDLPANELMSQLLGPSALVIVTHFHRIGALSSASGVGVRRRTLSVAANQEGALPFLRRMAILHSSKLLTACGLYFALRHVDVFGAVMMGGLVWLSMSLKTAAAPAEWLGIIAISTAVANYAFTVDYLVEEIAHDRKVVLLDWLGLREWPAPSLALWPRYEEMLRASAMVLVSNELVRASRRWLKDLPPALRSGCAPEPCHLFWPLRKMQEERRAMNDDAGGGGNDPHRNNNPFVSLDGKKAGGERSVGDLGSPGGPPSVIPEGDEDGFEIEPKIEPAGLDGGSRSQSAASAGDDAPPSPYARGFGPEGAYGTPPASPRAKTPALGPAVEEGRIDGEDEPTTWGQLGALVSLVASVPGRCAGVPDARRDVRGLRHRRHRQHERGIRRLPGVDGGSHGVENRGGSGEAGEPLESRRALLRGDRDVAVPRGARRAAERERPVPATAPADAAAAEPAEPAAAPAIPAADATDAAAAQGASASTPAPAADATAARAAAAPAREPATAALTPAALRRERGHVAKASVAAAGARRVRYPPPSAPGPDPRASAPPVARHGAQGRRLALRVLCRVFHRGVAAQDGRGVGRDGDGDEKSVRARRGRHVEDTRGSPVAIDIDRRDEYGCPVR